uniref:Uncharacterized protein n=1 Tax=Oryza sativa subsp. indica TaxID=39946 RepID=A0A679B9J1_ORYSI|nr:hypothetical protein [Oryza sativa Indica Group]BBD82529.1 hypothetical protein [Oryza sativa Indica Group]
MGRKERWRKDGRWSIAMTAVGDLSVGVGSTATVVDRVINGGVERRRAGAVRPTYLLGGSKSTLPRGEQQSGALGQELGCVGDVLLDGKATGEDPP